MVCLEPKYAYFYTIYGVKYFMIYINNNCKGTLQTEVFNILLCCEPDSRCIPENTIYKRLKTYTIRYIFLWRFVLKGLIIEKM